MTVCPPMSSTAAPAGNRRKASPRRKITRIGAGATVLALVLAACGSSSTRSAPPATPAPSSASTAAGGSATPTTAAAPTSGVQTLRIALDYTANVDYLGIYDAINLGYFSAHGIKPEIVPYTGTPAETLLAAGRTDLALTYPPNIPAYRASGLAYRAVAGLSQRNTIAIAVLASSRYTDVGQLSGTLYGGFGVPSDKPILEAVFRRAGVAKPTVKEITLNADAYQALAAHRVAYSIVFGGIDDLTAELQGVHLRTFPLEQYLGATFSFPDDAFVATDREIASRADLLRRGLAALAEGYRYAAAHPAAAEAILVKDNRSTLGHSANIVTATGNATAKTFLSPGGTWGTLGDRDFSGITALLVNGGLIKASKAPAASEDYTDTLLSAGS